MVARASRERPRVISTKITKGGQITLPAEARKALGVKPGDDVDVHVSNGKVTVVKPEYTLKELSGILQPPRPGFDIDQAIRDAKEEMAADAIRKMQIGRG
jgi:AbrB family looped-hinge helix DNA binding protein